MLAGTVYTMLEETAALHGERPALQQPTGGGKYRAYTWVEYRDLVRWTAVGLRTICVEKGHIVALQSETRAEFYFADLGVIAAGAGAAPPPPPPPLSGQGPAAPARPAPRGVAANPRAHRRRPAGP